MRSGSESIRYWTCAAACSVIGTSVGAQFGESDRLPACSGTGCVAGAGCPQELSRTRIATSERGQMHQQSASKGEVDRVAHRRPASPASEQAAIPRPQPATVRPVSMSCWRPRWRSFAASALASITNIAAVDANGISTTSLAFVQPSASGRALRTRARLCRILPHQASARGPRPRLRQQCSNLLAVWRLSTGAGRTACWPGSTGDGRRHSPTWARATTYIATTIDVMQAAGRRGIPVVILDRPNPVGGAMKWRNILDTAFSSMVGRLRGADAAWAHAGR